MTTTQAVRLLRRYNKWRRGADLEPFATPAEIGKAIDLVCDTLSAKPVTTASKKRAKR